jgi:hypothetical protein
MPASQRIRGTSSPIAPAISQAPVTNIVSRGNGTQSGTIGRKTPGERRCTTPAAK